MYYKASLLGYSHRLYLKDGTVVLHAKVLSKVIGILNTDRLGYFWKQRIPDLDIKG